MIEGLVCHAETPWENIWSLLFYEEENEWQRSSAANSFITPVIAEPMPHRTIDRAFFFLILLLLRSMPGIPPVRSVPYLKLKLVPCRWTLFFRGLLLMTSQEFKAESQRPTRDREDEYQN